MICAEFQRRETERGLERKIIYLLQSRQETRLGCTIMIDALLLKQGERCEVGKTFLITLAFLINYGVPYGKKLGWESRSENAAFYIPSVRYYTAR